MVIRSRRSFIVSAALTLVWSTSFAQGASFIGEWEGKVDGIGDARLIITAIWRSGQIEGRMEFPLQSFVSTFGDKSNLADRVSHGVVSGSALTIECALGGTFRLTISVPRLAGTYTRGATFSGTATFNRKL